MAELGRFTQFDFDRKINTSNQRRPVDSNYKPTDCLCELNCDRC